MSNFRRSFTDPDEFGATVRAAKLDITITGRGPHNASIVQLTFDNLWMQRLSVDFDCVSHVQNGGDRFIINFHPYEKSERLINTQSESSEGILIYPPGEEYFEKVTGITDIATMSLSMRQLVQYSDVLQESDLVSKSRLAGYTPPPGELARLRSLYSRTVQLFDSAPDRFKNVNVLRELEYNLVNAMIACVETIVEVRPARATWSHSKVMGAFYEFIRHEPSLFLHIPEICQAIGVSATTLRVACQDVLGISPLRYLWLRRMHKVRGQLMRADARIDSVTSIATANGFWELSRFATQYHALFRERPSETLRRTQG